MKLSQAAREQVTLFCATLENLVGSPAKAQADLRSVLWQTPLLHLEADELGGVIANNLSQFEEAERHFARAMTSAETLVEARLAQIHKGLAWRHWREGNLDQAERELLRARYEVENLAGRVQASRGDYSEAANRYKEALAIAESIHNDDGMAKTCNNLFNLYVNWGRFDLAQHYYGQAKAIYQRHRRHGHQLCRLSQPGRQPSRSR
jgi:tetratricopeptide (TPR) repeat protein